jgi:hypothetical protein
VLQARALFESYTGRHGEKLTRLHAAIFFQSLDHGHLVGWAPHRPRKPPCYADFVRVRLPCCLDALHSRCDSQRSAAILFGSTTLVCRMLRW